MFVAQNAPPPPAIISETPVGLRRDYAYKPRYPDSSRRSESSSNCEDDSRSVVMDNRDFLVSSKGDINASFSVPGLISIPSDNDSRNVTIVELRLDALMSWISIPKKEAKAHLTVS